MPLRIDNLSAIDLATVTVEELHPGKHTFEFHSKGRGYWKVTSTRTGIETPIGDIEKEVWSQAAKAVLHRDGMDEELEQMSAFYVERNEMPAFSKEELLFLALEGTIDKIYMDPVWVSFLEYNRQFHPELLAAAHVVEIVTDCCQAKVTYTEERLAREGPHIYCPACKAWTTYQGGPADAGQENTKGCES